jgi:rhodanese-related sulfurtransferase
MSVLTEGQEDLPVEIIVEKIRAGAVVLIDVREPREFAFERIHGSLLHPLSTFEPRAIPNARDQVIVFHCGSGKRSRKALDAFKAATGRAATHMVGGLGQWKAARFPTIKINPATGDVEDSGLF